MKHGTGNHANWMPAASDSELHKRSLSGDNPFMRGPGDGFEEQAISTDPAAKRGTVTVICGCMFSGKTSELLRRLTHFSPSSTLVFKHVIDQRYQADAVVSHDGGARSAIQISSANTIGDHLRPGITVVAVDEAHFFDLDLVNVTRLLADRGYRVIITTLDRSSWGRVFPVAEQLYAMADEPVVLHAVCARCGAVADHTQRLTPIVDGNMVGGPESYEARCEKCWSPPPEPSPDNRS